MKTINNFRKEKTEAKMIGIAILGLKGSSREQAMKVYRRLWSESEVELIYLARV